MMISKRLREEAAVLCSMSACSAECVSIRTMCERVYGVDINAVARLAVRAWDAANRSFTLNGRGVLDAATMRDDYAEAEALLRTGWTP
jgi:O-acetyl-ADP-ribose deacetylase (regulator of RNase III)